ncbi:MAG: hypothetical protein QW751_01535 [Candidatus Aenigmatarchaeota archaeon]|nr:hypothetical protein [Candidatus Aenigmarchaeota archaeon]
MAVILEPSMQALIPFLFTFAVVFGVLELTRVFKNRAVEAVIAFALAVFAITQPAFTTMLMLWLPSILSFFIIVFFIAFIFEIFGLRKKPEKIHPEIYAKEQAEKAGLLGVAIVLLFAVGGLALSQLGLSLPVIGGPENILFALGLIFIVALFWLAFKIGEEKSPPKQEGG